MTTQTQARVRHRHVAHQADVVRERLHRLRCGVQAAQRQLRRLEAAEKRLRAIRGAPL